MSKLEGSCETEDWSNDYWINWNKLHFKYKYKKKNLTIFTVFLDQLSVALVSMKYLFPKNVKPKCSGHSVPL